MSEGEKRARRGAGEKRGEGRGGERERGGGGEERGKEGGRGGVFFNDTATTEIYTLSRHDALPIYFRTTEPKGYTHCIDD